MPDRARYAQRRPSFSDLLKLPTQALPYLRPPVATALLETLKAGYSKAHAVADLMAGAVVGVVALPLAMALAIASGLRPEQGLYTAIIAGAAIALLGGSRVSVSGPTAAFVVILAPISTQYGAGGLLLASAMAGVMLIGMGLGRLGRLVEFIPHPVTTGFTTGIAVTIASLQLKDFLGLTFEGKTENFVERMTAVVGAIHTLHWPDLAIGALMLAVLLGWPRINHKVPAPLVATVVATLCAWGAHELWPTFEVATLGSRFHYEVDGVSFPGIPRSLPHLDWPWSFPGADGNPAPGLTYEMVRALLPKAFAIAMLGAIESLLCAVVADGMAGTKHDPDAELFGQGVGNLIAPFFGGFAATGAIARTATNVRAGGRSPFAALFHAAFVLVAMLLLAPALQHLPMAGLAGLLLLVAWNMSELKHFRAIVRVAPKSDVAVLLACFFLTVVFDMVVAVTAGVLLAALLFMRRMRDIAGAELIAHGSPELPTKLPPDVLVYAISGPLFFGAAQKAMETLQTTDDRHKTVVLDLSVVPTMDVTGLVALESTIDRLIKSKRRVILAGVNDQPGQLIVRAGIAHEQGKLEIYANRDDAFASLVPKAPAA